MDHRILWYQIIYLSKETINVGLQDVICLEYILRNHTGAKTTSILVYGKNYGQLFGHTNFKGSS